MEKKMNEESFRLLCQELRDAIVIKKDSNIGIMGNADNNIFNIACDIIDDSEGVIQIDNEIIRGLFEEILEIAHRIKHYSLLCTNRLLLMQKTRDYQKLTDIKQDFFAHKQNLITAYQDALIVTEKVLNLGRKK